MAKLDNHQDTAHCEHISRMLARISDKWSLLVVRVLGRGPCRFNALRREVGEISQKVLASTLRDLEENGFVARTVTPLTPPQVEYALTELLLALGLLLAGPGKYSLASVLPAPLQKL